MTHWRKSAVCLMTLAATIGCGGAEQPTKSVQKTDASAAPEETSAAETTSAPQTADAVDAADDPKVSLERFLTAIKAGDDETAASMLTPLARQKTSEMGLNVAPPGSDTATFKVIGVEMKGTTGAYVACEWNEVDEAGERSTDQVVWVMAKQEAGWRIAGMVAKIFPDLDAIVFNFEDPEDMIRKQEMAMQEMERRAAAAAGQPPAADGAAADSGAEPGPASAENSAARSPRSKRK